MKITDLPTELIYKIIEDYNTCDDYNRNGIMEFVNYQNGVYELFHLQKPRIHYKEYYDNVIDELENETFCYECDKFKPLKLFKINPLKLIKIKRTRYNPLYELNMNLCSNCYINN